jgi:DNA-directed RNA polymerase sigma subunit (sigma70/sigma32)
MAKSKKRSKEKPEPGPRHLKVFAERDGTWWLVTIPELDTVGQARSVREIYSVATEVAALRLNVPEDEVVVDVTVKIAPDALALWVQAEKAEAEAREAQQRSASLRREAVRLARQGNYTLDATAAAFGISRARVQQLEKAPARESVSSA